MQTALRSIILIEDDTPTNYLHTQLMREWGWKGDIYVFQSTEKALKFLAADPMFENPCPQGTKCHLILLDINMPRVDGWEFLQDYGGLPAERRAMFSVVILTTSLNPDDIDSATKITEVDGFYNKPLIREIFTNLAYPKMEN